MNLLKAAYNKAEDWVIRHAPFTKINVEAAVRKGDRSGSVSSQIERRASNHQAQTLKKWKTAVAAATDPDNPDRTLLEQLYENLMLDDHLESVIESRILHVQRSPFKLVDANGEEDKEMSNLFERPWFEEIMYKVIFSRFQGTTLIEMYDLNEDGELAQIDEIPQANFNAKKGIILKSPGDATGWSYRDGAFKDYYVQVGKNDALGMLERLAVIVLAKKLGLGSWLDYIEKYGVPPLFITTDREDDTRLKELFEAAMNFKSNNFMVGRGQEKFEVGKTDSGATAPFSDLLDRADQQISKRVLGGSGIVDDKSFVGSAEIQFKLATFRFESDKILFKYIFNAYLKPRLIKLSPVYAPLANLTFDWDNTESLTVQQLIDAISKLGQYYEIDAEYISTVTGIPIIAGKVNPAPLPGGDGGKKR